MRLSISSPDGLGDFILRLPMLRALEGASCKLQIFLRRPAYDLARDILPNAEIQEIANNPYGLSIAQQRSPFAREHRLIKKFKPDYFVAAAFAANHFDREWIRIHGVECLVGFLTGSGPTPAKYAEVDSQLHEVEKNRVLTQVILGHSVEQDVPELTTTDSAQKEAAELLSQHGVLGTYHTVCVGTRPGLRLKDWGESSWREFLGSLGDGHAMVFLGNTKESESIERIRRDLPMQTVNLAGDPPSLPVSMAILEKSHGYLGRDSGVMHMAVALGRPVLAIYSGAHWGRFLPARGPAAVVTQATPCRQCDGKCPFAHPHCVTQVRLATMREAWNVLHGPKPCGLKIFEQSEASLDWQTMLREAVESNAGVGHKIQETQTPSRLQHFLNLFGRR